jgi:hypothetical protein
MAWIISTQAYGGYYWENTTFGPFLPEPGDDDDGRKAAERHLEARRASFKESGYIGEPGFVVNE